jgi:peptidylprolyl isomerase
MPRTPVLTTAAASTLGLGAVAMLAFQPQTPTPTTPTTPTKAETPAEPKKEKITVKTPDGQEYTVLKTSEIKLVMEDLKIGDGADAKASSTITINYHGTLAKDGKLFDGNWGKAPATFPLSDLIQGWQIGIPGMKVGGIRRLTIPWALAYGERGGGPIPAKADLVFLIELKDVK